MLHYLLVKTKCYVDHFTNLASFYLIKTNPLDNIHRHIIFIFKKQTYVPSMSRFLEGAMWIVFMSTNCRYIVHVEVIYLYN